MIYLLLFYKHIQGSSGAIHSCMFYPWLTRCLDGLHILSFACQRGPSRRHSERQMILPFVYCQNWHSRILPIIYIFTRFNSTPWIFACSGFSAVSGLDDRLRDPLRSWGSFSFSMSPTFLKRFLKWSVNLLIVLLTFSKRRLRRCRRTCWMSPRELASSVPSDFLGGSSLFSPASAHLTARLAELFLGGLACTSVPCGDRGPKTCLGNILPALFVSWWRRSQQAAWFSSKVPNFLGCSPNSS